jgi:hypothetical protein
VLGVNSSNGASTLAALTTDVVMSECLMICSPGPLLLWCSRRAWHVDPSTGGGRSRCAITDRITESCHLISQLLPPFFLGTTSLFSRFYVDLYNKFVLRREVNK